MKTITTLVALAALAAAAPAQTESWRLVRPSNTGIPGIQLHYSTIAPDGRIWVAGRWPFWGEGGVGIYDAQTDLWETLSNVDTPQPGQWLVEVAFARDGTVWMATEAGLVRKNGDDWTVYTTANSPLLHNGVSSVALAPNGDVWINNTAVNAPAAAVFRIANNGSGTWTKFQVPEIPFAMPWRDLSEVLITPDGHAWVANDVLNGVAEYDGSTWTLRGADVGRFGSGIVDARGDLWFVAGIGGGNSFFRYRRAANQWDTFGPGNTPFVNTTITQLGQDSEGNVYCGNWAGQVIRFDGFSWTEVARVGDPVYGIDRAADGTYWICTLGNGTSGELHHVDAGGNAIRRYNTWNTGMPDYFVERMSLDPRGDLWFGTGEAGLSRFDGVRWRNWGNHNSGSEPYPFAGNEPMGGYYQDRAGTGWMGGNGIARWDRASGQFTGFWNWQNNPGMGVTIFDTFAEDPAGTLFAASENGDVMRFDGGMWHWEPDASSITYTSRFPGLQTDPQGRVWAVGELRLNRWDGSAWTEVGQDWGIFDAGGINVYEFAADGTMWIGTNEGLMRVSTAGERTMFTPGNSPLPAKQVQGIDIRADGLIAVSAHEFQSVTPFPSGVAVISGNPEVGANWRVYGYGTHPIPHYQLGHVQFDGDGKLWISAISEGIAVLDLGEPACAPDCNADGTLNLADFGCFTTKFALGDPYSDCNGDQVLNLSDFGCFTTEFALGCP